MRRRHLLALCFSKSCVSGKIISFHAFALTLHLFPPFFPEHSAPLDVEVSNMKFLARTEEFWDALEGSAWWQFEEQESSSKTDKKSADAADKKTASNGNSSKSDKK